MPFSPPFLGEGSPTKLDYRPKVGYPYSNLKLLEEAVKKSAVGALERLKPGAETRRLWASASAGWANARSV